MPDVIYEMSRKKLGVTAVVEGEKLAGIISDGDLRRLLEKRGKDVMDLTADEAMTRDPKTIRASEFAAIGAGRDGRKENYLADGGGRSGTAAKGSCICTIYGRPISCKTHGGTPFPFGELKIGTWLRTREIKEARQGLPDIKQH